jgi:hypothetical protein
MVANSLFSQKLTSKIKASEQDNPKYLALERSYYDKLDGGHAVKDTVDMTKVQGNDETLSLDTGLVVPVDLTKTYETNAKTVFDIPLGEVLDNTLSFTTFSFESYMKKVYEAETLLSYDHKNPSVKDNVMNYLVGFGLFVREEGNALYLGIVCILVSIIIYFLDITTR